MTKHKLTLNQVMEVLRCREMSLSESKVTLEPNDLAISSELTTIDWVLRLLRLVPVEDETVADTRTWIERMMPAEGES